MKLFLFVLTLSTRKEEGNIFNKKVLEICNQNMITFQKENKECKEGMEKDKVDSQVVKNSIFK